MNDNLLRIDKKLEEYHELDTRIKTMEKRKAELAPIIKTTLMSEVDPDEDGHIRYSQGSLNVTLQVKRRKLDADEGALQQLLIEKGLWEESKMEVVDRNIVTQLWIEGKLTDDDLRTVLPRPKDPNTALKVEYVQG